jgi:hypothetical protein
LPVAFGGEELEKSANQKQESPAAVMFVKAILVSDCPIFKNLLL